MNNQIKLALLPLGIGLIAIGIIFGLKIDKIFFLFVLIGLIFITTSFVNKKN